MDSETDASASSIRRRSITAGALAGPPTSTAIAQPDLTRKPKAARSIERFVSSSAQHNSFAPLRQACLAISVLPEQDRFLVCARRRRASCWKKQKPGCNEYADD